MIDTAALRKLRAETTQGEFVRYPDTGYCFDETGWHLLPLSLWVKSEPNAAFFAAAHTAMPALLDELDASRSEILTLRARLGDIADLTTMPLPEDWRKKEGAL